MKIELTEAERLFLLKKLEGWRDIQCDHLALREGKPQMFAFNANVRPIEAVKESIATYSGIIAKLEEVSND